MLLAEKDEFTVTLWSFEADVAESINDVHENRYLPGVRLPEALRAEIDLSRTLKGASVVISASPAQVVREVMTEAASNVPTDALVVSASKGIEISTLLRMDEVLGQILPEQIMDRFCVLSGPGFAIEVAGHAPTAVVIAGRTTEAAKEAQKIFQRPYFRIYTNTDIVGVELGGALKNVVALAAGITSGLGYGHNTIAAVITRGLAEMTRLGVAMGGERATFSGLAGMGDLLLTCTGDLSRNRTVGVEVASSL
jgi:glycerol-3-phosphate dehydrogenase (NAD(P)+)